MKVIKEKTDKEREMKVLLINYGPKPLPATQGGGVETLIETFYKNYSKKIELSIASYYDEKAYKLSGKYEDVNFIYINRSIKFKFSQAIRYFINRYSNRNVGNAFIVKLRKSIDFNDYDIIVSENGINMGMYLRKKFVGKIILHLHNDSLNIHTKGAEIIKKSYDQIWTLSNYVRKRVDAINGDTTTKTLYNGVDLELFSAENIITNRDCLRKQYGIKRQDIVFGYSGRLVEEKGVRFLIQSFNKLAKEYDNIWLLVIGDNLVNNKYVNSLMKIAGDRVVFTGYIPYSKMPKTMSCVDIGVAPTVHLNKYYDRYNNYCGIIEGFNLTVIEFMGMGKPMIITNSGGMPELVSKETGVIISSNETLIYDELVNAMRVMIESPKYSPKEIGKHAKFFSLERYVNTFEEYLEDIYEK